MNTQRTMRQAGWTVLALCLAGAPALAQTSTAQSVMVHSTTPEAFVIKQDQTWAFQSDVGRDFYTNAWDGNTPTVRCTGQGCSNEPVPGVTSGCLGMPDPQAGRRVEQAVAEKCTFFDGGALVGTSYTRQRNCNYSSGANRGNWTFTYTYLVAPVAERNPVDSRTAWMIVETSGSETVPVEIGALIASQSAQNNEARGRRAWTRKYSFTMAGSDGGSRVSDLQVRLSGSADDVAYHGHVLDTNPIATDPANAEFRYVGNAGENPALSPLLVPAGIVSEILTGIVPARDGRFDDFAGNDQVVGQVDFAYMDRVVFELGEGDYTIRISGLVKGVAAGLDHAFGVDLDLDIDAEECTP